MHRLQELIRLYRLGTGVRERARLLGMSTRTERTYRLCLAEVGLLEGGSEALPDLEAIAAAIGRVRPVPGPRVGPTSLDQWLPEIRARVDKGARPQAIYDRLKRKDPSFTGSLSAVKRAVRRIRAEGGVQADDVAIPVETAPGEVAQVDFGYAGRFFDEQSGMVRKAWVFVMVLGYSRHLYAELVLDQKASTWVRLHMAAFRFFGGVPHTIVPDNLKAAVVRAAFGAGDRHELALNRSYRELARHYRFLIDPAPVRAPEKKGKVESAVKYVCGNFLAGSDFETLREANDDLPDWLQRTAGTRIHGATGRRPLEAFAEEQGALRPLPRTPYDPVLWHGATVHRDSHIVFDGRLYSVPWPHLGARVWVKATHATVAIYAGATRIATHERRGLGRRSTVADHLPPHRSVLAERSIAFWTERADALGEDVGAYIRHVIASDPVLSKLRDVQAIVTHLETFPPRRAQAAVRRADYFGNYTFQGIRRILAQALDLEPLEGAEPAFGHLDAPRFARDAARVAAPTQEAPHDAR